MCWSTVHARADYGWVVAGWSHAKELVMGMDVEVHGWVRELADDKVEAWLQNLPYTVVGREARLRVWYIRDAIAMLEDVSAGDSPCANWEYVLAELRSMHSGGARFIVVGDGV